MTNKQTDALKTWIAILSVAVASGIAWGTLRSDVGHNAVMIDKKADQDTIDTHFGYIRQQLAEIKKEVRK